MSPLIKQSDKFFWHRYIEFYESFFADRKFESIAEVGVFKGNSIRWLLERFPESQIVGGDILPIQSNWPIDPRVEYRQMDQGNLDDLDRFFSKDIFDLVIDDGSHIPEHQLNTLMRGWQNVQAHGIFVIEDIHTCLNTGRPNVLNLLLAVDHCQTVGADLDLDAAASTYNVNVDRLRYFYSTVDRIHFYKRTHLPLSCWSCGSSQFNYSRLQCECGAKIYDLTDSMTCLIQKK